MGETTLNKALLDYKTIYMPYRNFAERTREEYQNDLEDFLSFLKKVGVETVKTLDLRTVERYVADLENRGFASHTRKRKVVTIRSFLMFLFQDGYIASNIAKSVILPYAETNLPYVLTRLQCDRLRAACAAIPRDRAIIELLLQTGITLSELIRLTIDDIDVSHSDNPQKTKQGFLRIQGSRGKKDRLIPLSGKVVSVISAYLSSRPSTNQPFVFLSKLDGPISERGVQKMFRKYAKRAGIERASIATLRHTFGAYKLAQGMSLKDVQEVMGHRDIRSTTRYIAMPSLDSQQK